MKLVHLADLHLGYSQFDRVDSTGRNMREQDVMRTFSTLIDQVIAIRPQLIVIAGDVFHKPKPSNNTVLEAYAGFSRLVHQLPNTRVVMAAGNHDLALSTDIACILRLFETLGIHVFHREAGRVSFPEYGVSVLAVPDAPGMKRPPLDPDASAKYSVLVLHGEVHGMMTIAGGRRPAEIPTDEIQSPRWNYVALGHYHVYRQLAPNMSYSGSIDFTSSDPWGEQREAKSRGIPGKGFIERDLATGEQIFHPLPVSRRHIDMESIGAFEQSAADIDAAIAQAIEAAGDITDQVVRCVITDIPKEISRELDPKAIRALKRRALNFHLSFRRPEVIQAISAGGMRRMRPLEEVVGEFFARRFANDPVLGAQISGLSSRYLNEAAEQLEGRVGLAALTASAESAA